ncbi:hypothetical protein BCU68_12430 [Vibrio sp. 10N.286.49.B3]|uniref:metallophosphoesterase n=1 Tax=Vibrio sp. 10N.286.49.B3 TaxID=1880855 RepID=UPI000C842562|nr:metallophosphoesterase [Vibrio sp. 10N.286.49.B3]PMH44648.1 hypothetical protein BCU68_12430 [Vibrio sp. 10N.286.49.B3]
MALITKKYFETLFSDLNNYSLRGNSALWEMIREVLIKKGDAYSAKHLMDKVDEYVEALTNSISNDDSQDQRVVYIEALNQGGMSGGQLDIDHWFADMRPTLSLRCHQLEMGLQFKEINKLENLFFIGDVHGQTNKLNSLLEDQGLNDIDADIDTKIVFIGDLIDNSEKSDTDHVALLNKVKQLVDEKKALCLMGNHEFNAIGWYLKDANGTYLRDRTKIGNQKQHAHFLVQIGEDSLLHKKWIEWFMTLPLYINAGDIRAIHACWHEPSIEKLEKYLNSDRSLKSVHWTDAFNPSHELYTLIEVLLKGPEVSLPTDCYFKDKNGIQRHHIRAAWWKDEYSLETYQDLAVVPTGQADMIPNQKLAKGAIAFNKQNLLFPVVVGHYTLAPTLFPECLSDQVVCVDFNAAKGENALVGYYTYLDGWSDSPSELIDDNNFSYEGELNTTSVITDGFATMLKELEENLSVEKPDNRFAQTVSHVLLTEWDPIGVYDPEFFDEDLKGEYVDYESTVNRLAQTGDKNKLAAYLMLIELHIIGVTRDNAERLCAMVAYKLVGKWVELASEPL